MKAENHSWEYIYSLRERLMNAYSVQVTWDTKTLKEFNVQ